MISSSIFVKENSFVTIIENLKRRLLEKIRRSRALRDASLNRSRNPSPEGVKAYENIWGDATAIPVGKDKGHTLATIDIEYEWKPPRSSHCLIFDHITDKCPKVPKETIPTNTDDEGFVEVKKKKNKNKSRSQCPIDGIRLTKPPPKMYYRRVEAGESSKASETQSKGTKVPISVNKPVVTVRNSFDVLDRAEKEDEVPPDMGNKREDVLNASDSEVDEEIMVEERRGRATSDILNKGASTPVPKDWTSNGACYDKGTRIIIGRNHNDVDVVVITQDAQAIHTRIWLKAERKEVFCSFIYAHNRYTQRCDLWRNLSMHKVYIRDRLWCLLGDFNAALFLEDSTASGANIDISMREFRDCVEDIEVMDVHRTGLQFTWNQKPKGTNGLLKKIDKIMANIAFNDQFVGAHAIFKPYRIYDHSPLVLSLPTLCNEKPKPFKFFNVLTKHERFMEVVKEGWSNQISGFHMFNVVKKLKNLKKPIRKLLYEKGNLHANVSRLRTKLDSFQSLLDMDPFNASLREEEASYVVEFNQAALMEERFLKQKAKINWLKEGDSNSAYFYKTVKSRVSRSRIDTITNTEGLVLVNEAVPNVFVSHYETFLGLAGETQDFDISNLFKMCLNEQVATDMVRSVMSQEVKEALFSMGDDKSPGPDGYTACFFKAVWEVVADDVTNVIREFFRNGNLLKELNHTIIALIPKVKSPTRVNDYRPISCCNVLFKCISKIIANRIKHSLKLLISPNQSAFVPGTPRCAFKVDIQKAYDTVDWEFLRRILHGFGFHACMIAWIMECYCSKLELINLCFADDLFLFAYGDVHSASIIKETLDEFKAASGLTPSLPKSTAYFCNVLNHVKVSILQILPFEEGKLPKNKSLSAAGRLQLIRSDLGAMHIYWASVFILPSRVLLNIEQLVRDFLWSHSNLNKGRSKVAWEVICLPKNEGGLGIRRLEVFNSALMIAYVWKLLSLKESLWVKWIHKYKLKGCSFWEIPVRGDGAATSLWFDKWCDLGPLSNFISSRDIFRAGLTRTTRVRDVIQDGVWSWPQELQSK
ncbi:hypothetical protein Tco_0316387 [Tanacetum coccineum]